MLQGIYRITQPPRDFPFNCLVDWRCINSQMQHLPQKLRGRNKLLFIPPFLLHSSSHSEYHKWLSPRLPPRTCIRPSAHCTLTDSYIKIGFVVVTWFARLILCHVNKSKFLRLIMPILFWNLGEFVIIFIIVPLGWFSPSCFLQAGFVKYAHCPDRPPKRHRQQFVVSNNFALPKFDSAVWARSIMQYLLGESLLTDEIW